MAKVSDWANPNAKTMKFTTPECLLCHKESEVRLPREAAMQIMRGVPIQHAWPEASPEKRELIITGTHPKCWDQLTYGGED